MQQPWINLVDYTVTELLCLGIGTLFWIWAYYMIIHNAIKYKRVEMPFLAVCSNIAWEFAWGFMLETDLGLLFQWGLRIWFFLDVFIFYFTIKYGAAQMSRDIHGKTFVPLLIAITLWWIPVFYFFETENHDTKMGTTSAFMITIVMTALFVFNATRKTPGLIATKTVSWGNFLGNIGMGIFVFMHHPNSHFLHLMVIAVLVLNIVYIRQTYTRPTPEAITDENIK